MNLDEKDLRITSVTVNGNRGGTVLEITQFLKDFEYTYNKLYLFEIKYSYSRLVRNRRIRFNTYPDELFINTEDSALILPEHHLFLNRININSPGFWEFLGSANPLQQIREYLNDRHRRRQDSLYRETSEKEKLELENEILRRQITQTDNKILSERIEILRDMGYSNEEIRRLLWINMGQPLSLLGKHQDTELISEAD